MISDMETRRLDAFLAVATHLHFGLAAKSLFLKQSTLSETIRALEAEIGGPLFERTSRRVTLTDLGSELYLTVVDPLHELQSAIELAKRRARGDQDLVVGFLGGGFYELTQPFQQEVDASPLSGRVKLREYSLVELIPAILRGDVDIALLHLPLGLPALRRGPVLMNSSRYLAVRADHRLSQLAAIDPEELRTERIVRLPASVPSVWADYHFPRTTPSGFAIADGPTIRTVREGLALVESGDVVMPLASRAIDYYRQPNVSTIPLLLPPVRTALVIRANDRRDDLLALANAANAAARQAGTWEPQEAGWHLV